MKKKFLGRVLTMLLVASMVFTLLPASAIAAGNWWWNADEYTEEAAPAATADNSYQYNIFFLDCGRKYYSVNSIKTLIDNASAAGFNYIQLAVGNDGLRLLLDDMSLKVNGTTYTTEQVSDAIHTGNEKYYNFLVDELTQSEMSDIIAYAKSKGMGVIPCVNTPGHMDAILSAANTLTGTNCSYNGSARTIDVTNATATAFTKALLQKYITYFAGKGCQLFNMGADEYANDVYTTGSMGFGNLQSTGKYSYYVTYVNEVAAMIEAAGMTPMAFNDGIYFNNVTSSGTFDTDIIICYWSNGWSGYTPMPAATLASEGFKLVNTNGAYYWVLGKADAQCDASKAAQFNYLDFPRGKYDSSVSESAGSMFCIWADYPGDETEENVINKTADTIAAFGSKLPKLNTTPVQPDTGITITPEGGTTSKLDSAKNESIVLNAGKVVTWSYNPELVKLMSADASSDVALADLTLRAQRVTVTPVAGASGTATITAADENGNSDTFPIEVVNSSATTGVPVELKVGDTSKPYTVEGDVTGQVDTTSYNAAIATYQATPRTETTPGGEEKTTYLDGQEFYIKNSKGEYFNVSAKWGDKDTTGKTTTWIGRTRVGAPDEFYLESASDSKKYIECKAFGTWAVSNGQTSKFTLNAAGELTSVYTSIITHTLGTPYKNVPASSTAYTDITFTGVGEGETSVTIGGTTYNINVSYYEQPVNVLLNQSKTVEVSGTLNTDGLNTAVAEVSISTDGTTMTVNGKAKGETSVIVGNTKYLITVSTEDLEAVTPLKIEYWITNGPVQRSEGDTTNYFTVSAAMDGIATQNGVEVTADTMIPKEGYKKDGGRTVDYWQCRLLDTSIENDYGNGTQKQTSENGDDETTSGVAFTKVRYYGGHWAVYTEKNEWVEVKSNHQLVAYYMELINISNKNGVNELKINAADWGVKGDGSGDWGYNPEDTRCSVSIQVVYTGGDTNPAGTDAESLRSKTLVYYLDENTERGIGTMIFSGEQDYSIYKITAETGTMTSSESGTSVTVNSFTWADNALTVWGSDDEKVASKSVTLANPTSKINYESPYDRLTWNKNAHNKNNAILLRVYVVAEKNEDSLTVHYLDQGDENNEFYSYNITVNRGTYFNEGFALVKETNPKDNHLINHTVTNSSGQTQKAEINLLNVNAPAKYRYANFTCVNATRDAGGKDVYLYYTFDNSVSFVADFGLPLTIKAQDLSDAFKDGSQVNNQVVNDAPKHGTAVFDGINIVYTPGNTFPSNSGDTFTVTYTGENPKTHEVGSASFVINILPASNVLYEASFLTQGSKDNGPEWTPSTATTTRKQQTQKVGDTTTTDYSVFGHDKAYDDAYGPLGAWQLGSEQNPLQPNKVYSTLKTEFYGNGFDLIGNCGPRTGRVILFVENAGPGKGKLVDVDTRYGADTFYQVPLAHVMMAEEASYNVTVYAAGLKATNATPASYSLRGAATYASDYAADSYDAVLNGILAENGLTMADVEYVKGDSAPAAAKSARRATSFYALDTAAGTGTVTHEAGDHVEIDGFRVYRSTDNTNNTNYPEGEKNVQYLNILDAVSSFTAFVEGSGSDADWTVRKDYENAGGPQNEIYLRKTNGENSAIAFKVDPNAIVQISARAVENKKAATLVVNGTETVIATNTEMYYTVKANERGIVTIKNTGEGMLALGNLKIKNGTQAAALSEEAYPAAIALLSLNAAPETPDTVFEPTISAKVTTTKFIRSKVVTLTVSASADVAKLTVNGKELRHTNGWLVSMGWSKSYNYILTETVKKSETKTYEIIGYSADGTASAPTVVTSK